VLICHETAQEKGAGPILRTLFYQWNALHSLYNQWSTLTINRWFAYPVEKQKPTSSALLLRSVNP